MLNLNGWMMKPPNFDENKKYPVLMYVYGGPGSQTVTNSWEGITCGIKCSVNKVILLCLDNRGTGGRGSEFKKCTYKELGEI